MPPTPRNALHATIQAQSRQIQSLLRTVGSLQAQVDFIGRVSGTTAHLASLRTQADANNPAEPVPDPASEAPFQTTEEALAPEATDDPQNLGMTPGSVQDLPADATTTPMVPGVALPTQPFNQLVDVTAPVAGTETHIPNNQTRIETDVRVGDPDNPEKAFPWTLPGGTTASRGIASLRLARLRLSAGIAEGDDLGLAAQIEADASLTAQAIMSEIDTLDRVTKAAAKRRVATPTRAGLVPRAASASQGDVARTVPSLTQEAVTASANGLSVDDDMDDSLDF